MKSHDDLLDNIVAWLYCRWNGHDWRYESNPETLITEERTCVTCLKAEVAEIKWKKKVH